MQWYAPKRVLCTPAHFLMDDFKKEASGKQQKTNPMVRSLLESHGGGMEKSNVKNEFHIIGEASLLSSVLHPPLFFVCLHHNVNNDRRKTWQQ